MTPLVLLLALVAYAAVALALVVGWRRGRQSVENMENRIWNAEVTARKARDAAGKAGRRAVALDRKRPERLISCLCCGESHVNDLRVCPYYQQKLREAQRVRA